MSSSSSSALHHTTHKLFVYGTLKRGFYNHRVYLAKAEARQTAVYRGTAMTQDNLTLQLRGPRYIPALMKPLGEKSGSGCPVRGEVYDVSDKVLQAMDVLEGVARGFYYRMEIPVLLSPQKDNDNQNGENKSDNVLNCWVYLQNPSLETSDDATPHYPEYTAELHAKYVPPTTEPDPEILQLLQESSS